MSILDFFDSVLIGTVRVLKMDTLEVAWWLITNMIYGCHLYALFHLTKKDSRQHGNKMEHRHPAKLLLDLLLGSGALWLWSNLVLCFVGSVVCYIAIEHIEVQKSDKREFFEFVYLCIRLITGLAWLWNHKIVLFPSFFGLVIYAIVIIVRDGSFTLYVKQEAYTSYPLATAPVSHLVQNRNEDNRVSPCDSDINMGFGSSRSTLWSVTVGQNVNAGGGIQIIKEVSFGRLVEVHRCRDVIFPGPSVINFTNESVPHPNEPVNVQQSHRDIYELPQHHALVSSIPSRNKMAQKFRNMLKKLKRWFICA